MARKIDKQSTRQKVFAYLDKQTERPRSDVVEDIKAKHNIGQSYAMTLYQSHRTLSKVSGVLTEVFRIRDRKEGKSVAPYVSTKFVAKANRSDAKNKDAAVTKYESELTKRIEKAKKL